MDPFLEVGLVMGSLLHKDKLDWGEFLKLIWEKKCHRFAFGEDRSENASKSDGNLWSTMTKGGFDILTHILDNTHPIGPNSSQTNEKTPETKTADVSPPLLFRDLQPMDDPEEIQQLFGRSLYAAYLAGISIVWNHAEDVSPEVAALCLDLQHAFPHAYANAYLTPPHSQTVPAHADDRDVLVFQLVGTKHWKVYEKVPVAHPYPHEQVGKSDLAVPESVLSGPLAFDGCLVPGDVLYLPRGMVHEASTTGTKSGQQSSSDLSFHITVALATHDWTLGGNLSRMLQSKLLQDTNLRRSLLPTADSNPSKAPKDDLVSCGGSLVDAKSLQKQLDAVFERLRSQITAHSILQEMDQRIQTHNTRASKKRLALAARSSNNGQQEKSCENQKLDRVVGPLASQTIALDTVLRASTPAEKEHAQQKLSTASGLTVRDGVGDDVASVVGAIKGGAIVSVGDFRDQLVVPTQQQSSLCDLTALSLAKRAVELGAFCIVTEKNNKADAPCPKRQKT